MLEEIMKNMDIEGQNKRERGKLRGTKMKALCLHSNSLIASKTKQNNNKKKKNDISPGYHLTWAREQPDIITSKWMASSLWLYKQQYMLQNNTLIKEKLTW